MRFFKILFAIISVTWKYPKFFFVLITLSSFSYGYEKFVARPTLLYLGEPKVIDFWNPYTFFHVLRNEGFILGYSDLRGNPLWVEYALTPVDKETEHPLKRPNHFETDWRAFNRVTHEDYTKSGYDRGHNAPNYAMSRLYGKHGQADSFLMTNISPQKEKLNRQLWQRLEEVEIDFFAKNFGKVWVITGPIFDEKTEHLSTSNKVEIPDAFYKIYITEETPEKPSFALSFMMPQMVNGKEPLNQFVTTIDKIEEKTGLDFFADLPDDVEKHLEASIDTNIWNLQVVNKTAPRY